ncbi:MAG: hypothetical protein QXD13_00665 [Candidatus Pacearchaeota archaeon]
MQKTTKKKLYFAGLIALVIVIIVASYLTFFYTPRCQNFECFREKMIDCSKGSYVNEKLEASWGYKIIGKSGKSCAIRVTLLNAKKGELGIENLVGEQMECYYPIGVYAYPESDLSKCHGLLKEDLQSIVINKLHAYILENLGKFEEGLSKVV